MALALANSWPAEGVFTSRGVSHQKSGQERKTVASNLRALKLINAKNVAKTLSCRNYASGWMNKKRGNFPMFLGERWAKIELWKCWTEDIVMWRKQVKVDAVRCQKCIALADWSDGFLPAQVWFLSVCSRWRLRLTGVGPMLSISVWCDEKSRQRLFARIINSVFVPTPSDLWTNLKCFCSFVLLLFFTPLFQWNTSCKNVWCIAVCDERVFNGVSITESCRCVLLILSVLRLYVQHN